MGSKCEELRYIRRAYCRRTLTGENTETPRMIEYNDTPGKEVAGAYSEATIGISNATTPLTLSVPVHGSSDEQCEEEQPE